MWMGVIWIGLGIYLLVRGGFLLPQVNLELGWFVVGLGIFRVFWWWLSVEKPRREREALKQETQNFVEEIAEKEHTN